MRLRSACALVLVAGGLALCVAALLPTLRGHEAQEAGRLALAEKRASEALPEPDPTPTVVAEAAEASATAQPPSPLVGEPLARLRIPAAQIDAVVFEGDDADTLEKGPGHVPRTEQPGRSGGANNCVIVAHRDSYFRNLGWLRPGHRIEVETPEARQTYTVVSREVIPPGAVRVLAPTSTPRLTLLTCYPFNVLGPAPNRLVIVAEPEATQTALSR